MSDRIGFPPLVTSHPGIDRLGLDCRISPSVTVMRIGSPLEERGIFLGDEVLLFDHVRLLIGDLRLSPQTGIRLGQRVIINVGGYISGEGGLVIDDDVLIGAHVRILSAGHAIHGGEEVIARNPITHGAVHIEAGAWLGAGCTILQGVTIGRGAAVGAGSVVTRDVPPFAVAVGNPARVIRYREGHMPAWWQRLLRRWR
jgi:carbonic anhydrase/acetyltransferase-like protein (isoleucine patch superfamily)